MTRKPFLESTSVIIPRSVHLWGEDADRLYAEHYAILSWPELVGSPVAEHVFACGIKNSVLWLAATAPAWQNEIKLKQRDILDRINTCAGMRVANNIMFVRGGDDISTTNPAARFARRRQLKRKEEREISHKELSDDELENIQKKCDLIDDSELRKTVLRAMIVAKKSKKNKFEAGWHKCEMCSRLCPTEEKICHKCRQKSEESISRSVREVLSDMPWAHYTEIKKLVPNCTNYIVNMQRTLMIQRLAKKIKLEDSHTMEAKFLVMLYRILPPEQLTEEIVAHAMYDLRGDLAKPIEFKPISRKEFVKQHLKEVEAASNLTDKSEGK